MNPELERVVRDIRKMEHYREVDYTRLAEERGESFLLRRLGTQLEIYDRHSGGRRVPLLCRRLFRAAIRAGLWCAGELDRSRRAARTPVGETREVFFEQLPPAFDGYRVLQLTDFHFDFIPDMPERLVPVLEDVEADLCVLTGDYRGETHGPYRESLDHLRRTRPLLGEKVYAVLGNHDNIEIAHALPEMDIHPLVNEAVWLEREGERILLAGIDDAHMYKTHDFGPILPMIREAAFTLLLSHSPEAHAEAAVAGVEYMLSGHTHGGQLCLPGGVPLIAHLRGCTRGMIRGPWETSGTRGYTSRGVGVSSVDCRLFCPPEYTVHVLRRGKG